MMKRILITLVIFILLGICNCDTSNKKLEKSKECDKYVTGFAEHDRLFTQCAIKHAVPVSLCMDCVVHYKNMTTFYDELYYNTNCREMFFNKDRLNIIENMYLHSKSLWEKAYCSDCANFTRINEFMHNIDDLNNCITNSTNEKNDTCNNCAAFYERVNSQYKDIAKKSNEKICFDIQDTMNRTRIMWSKTLKCYKRTTNLTIFYILSSIFLGIPFVFYGSIVIYTRRRDNNQEILTADLEGEHRNNPGSTIEACGNNDNDETNSHVNDVNEPQPSTSLNARLNQNQQSNSSKKITKNNKHNNDKDDDDDEDDEDIIPLDRPLIQLTPPNSIDSEKIMKKIK